MLLLLLLLVVVVVVVPRVCSVPSDVHVGAPRNVRPDFFELSATAAEFGRKIYGVVSSEGAADSEHMQTGPELAVCRSAGRISSAAAFNVDRSIEWSIVRSC